MDLNCCYCCVCGKKADHPTDSFHWFTEPGNPQEAYHYCHKHAAIGKKAMNEYYDGSSSCSDNTNMEEIKGLRLQSQKREEVKKYLEEKICILRETEGVEIDLRFEYFGDSDRFLTSDYEEFSPLMNYYHVDDLEQVKKLILNTYLIRLSQAASYKERIALYVCNIRYTGEGYIVMVGGALYKPAR